MSRDLNYTAAEKQEIIALLSTDLREAAVSEAYFRKRMAQLGHNATEIDQLVNEALKPT